MASPDSTPTPSKRSSMTAKLVAMGYRGQDLASIIAPGRTRRQIADDLITAQKSAPKGD